MASYLDAMLISVAQVIAIQMAVLFLLLLMHWMLRRRTKGSTGRWAYRGRYAVGDLSLFAPSPESGGSGKAKRLGYGMRLKLSPSCIKEAGIDRMSKDHPQSHWQEAERRAREHREKLQREQESAQPAGPSGPAKSATTAGMVVTYDEMSKFTEEQWNYLLSRYGFIRISVREANELRFIMSKEFVTARAEAYHSMMKRIDRILNDRGVEPIKTKFDLEKP